MVELIDISNAADTNGVEQLTAVIVIGVAQPRSSYLNVGNWEALAGGGDCNPKTTNQGDAALIVARGHNYLYRNNFYLSAALQTEHRTFFSGIKVAGAGSGSFRYPNVFNPDLIVNDRLEDSDQNPTLLSTFSLVGSPSDNFHPYAVTTDCVLESEINTYVQRVHQKIYDLSPAPLSGKEPFNVQMETLWGMSQPAQGHHYFYAVYFGDPHTL